MILLKVIFYLLVFFPFLGTSSDYLERVSKKSSFTITPETLKPLKDLAEAEFINNESASDWRSLKITNISSRLHEQCPKSYFGLNNVVKEYNENYRGLEKENEAWMKKKINELIERIKSCREEIRKDYVKFSHEVVGPLHRAYKLDNTGSVYNKDEFRFLNGYFLNYLQDTQVVKGSRFSDLRDILVNYKDWQDICVTGEGGINASESLQGGQGLNDGGYGLTTVDVYRSLSQFIKSGCNDRFKSVKTEMRSPLVKEFVNLPGECSVASNEENSEMNSKIMKFKGAIELKEGVGSKVSTEQLDVMNFCKKELEETSNLCDPESLSNLSRIHARDKKLCGQLLESESKLNDCSDASISCKKNCNDRFQLFRNKYRDYFFIVNEKDNIHFKYGTECKGVLEEINENFKKSLSKTPYSTKEELREKDLDLSSSINLGVICEGPEENLQLSYNELEEVCKEEEVAKKRQVASSLSSVEPGSLSEEELLKGNGNNKDSQLFQYEEVGRGASAVSGGSVGLAGGGIETGTETGTGSGIGAGTGSGIGAGIGADSNTLLEANSNASLMDNNYLAEEAYEESYKEAYEESYKEGYKEGYEGKKLESKESASGNTNVVSSNNHPQVEAELSEEEAGFSKRVVDKMKEGVIHLDKKFRDFLLSHHTLKRRSKGKIEKLKDKGFELYNRMFPNEDYMNNVFAPKAGFMRQGVKLREVTSLMSYWFCKVKKQKPMHGCALSLDDPERYTRSFEGVLKRLNFLTGRQLVTPEEKRMIKEERVRRKKMGEMRIQGYKAGQRQKREEEKKAREKAMKEGLTTGIPKSKKIYFNRMVQI